MCPDDPTRTLPTVFHEAAHHEYSRNRGYATKYDLVFRICLNARDEVCTSAVKEGALPQMQNELYAHLLENDFENALRPGAPFYRSADLVFYKLIRFFHPDVVLGSLDELERAVKRSELVARRELVLARLSRYRQLAESKKATLDHLGIGTYKAWQQLLRDRADPQRVRDTYEALRKRLPAKSPEADWVLATDYGIYLENFLDAEGEKLPEALQPDYQKIKDRSFFESGA